MFAARNYRSYLARFVALFVVLTLANGCGGGGEPAGPETSVATTISANSSASFSSTVGAPVTDIPTVMVRNQRGAPMAGVAVSFSVTGGGGTVAQSSATTNAAGVASSGGWTLGSALGANTLVASSGTLAPVTFTATAIPGAASVFTKSAGDAQSAVAGSAVAVAPSVTITDALGNPLSGVSVTFAVASGGGSVTGGSQTTSLTGTATVGGWTLGTTVGANTLVVSSGTLAPLTFTATGTVGAAASIAKVGDGQSAIAGNSVAVAPSVTVSDANGNPVSGVSVVFTVASGGGSVSNGSQTTNAAGVATVGGWTLGTTAGANTLSVGVGSLSPVSFSATGTVGPAATIAIVSGNNQTVNAATQVPIAPSVIVRDANGNAVSVATVTFAVGLGGGTVTGGSQATSSLGAATVGSWTLGQSGANTLVASVGSVTPVTFNATANVPAVPCGLTVAYTIGSTANGSLDASDCHLSNGSFAELYATFLTARAYRFTMTAGFDTHLYLDQSPGATIAEMGVSGGKTSTFKALIPEGDYVIKASSFDPATTGSYTMSSSLAPIGTTGCEDTFVVKGLTTGQILQTSDCVSGGLYSDHYVVFLTAGQMITVTESSTAFDAALEIYSGTTLVASNNDKDGTTTDAQIVFTASSSGYYKISATSSITGQVGTYTLTIQ